MATEAAIKLKAIEKSYGRQPVLRGITLEIARGELCAVVGTSGSGKSTLLNIMGGLDSTYTGTCEVLGQRLDKLSDTQLSHFRNSHVGFVFQHFHLLDHLTVAENVALPSFFGRPGKGDAVGVVDPQLRAYELLKRVGLAGREQDYPNALSGGQKQRVAIARALYRGPELMLCDEPTGNLDSETGRQIIALFDELAHEGLTLVIVTHEERVSRAARRVIRLEDGRLAASDASADGVAGAGAATA